MRTNARISFVKLSEAERYNPETGEYNKVDKNKMTISGLVTSVSTDMKAQVFGDIRNQVIAINILRGCDDFTEEVEITCPDFNLHKHKARMVKWDTIRHRKQILYLELLGGGNDNG